MKLEKHHTIGFDSIEKIDWHLRNMWTNESLSTIIYLDADIHHKRHSKKSDWYGRYSKSIKKLNKSKLVKH